MKITLIAGARPNFMKVAPIIKAIKAHNGLVDERISGLGERISFRLVHTGQHYDKNMSDTFFEELGIPAPDVNLGCGGGSQAEQTAAIMVAFEKELMEHPADIVLVVGDVTSTMACSIVAKKLNTKVCHVEAGIRSWDLTMPEEINRMVTDSLADYMFTTSEVANRNLVRQGAELVTDCGLQVTGERILPEDKYANQRIQQRVWHVGNVMIDTLLANRARFRKPEVWDELGLKDKEFIVMTMHRPANVDEENHLWEMMEQIVDNVHGLPVIFPIHPRTAKMLRELINERPQANSMSATESLNDERFPNLHIVEPMGYLEFNYLVERAKAVVTDSGGITEETTVMGVPCITLRDNTERPETCTVGTNELIGTDPKAIKPALDKLFAGEWKKGAIPELWDGHAAERIVKILSALEIS
ncbi:MAG: UDP-N-acetyl glucosamine 2-epimerase [Paludibacteraceae bacterium]|nr:UDP-N-acetyl glucosamine 2-epimerase [Paludibacteraceae bacterium]MBQ6984061.1 UDP-N-acetyl glucosamine 2-epimerase [Paludibacteraceae bacterium]